jgi:hypothetical protein
MRIAVTLLVAVVVAAVVFGLSILTSPLWTAAVMLGLVVVVALLLLVVAKTAIGRRAGTAVGRRVIRTRAGRRMASAQLRAEAKRKGIRTTDPFGRELSDVELQLELVDTPETRAIRRQLRTMNPQQRAQALRMLASQSEEAQRTGVAPQAPPPRRPGVSGRPITKPPRSRRRRKR